MSPRNPAAEQCAIRLRAAVSGLSRRLRSATADVGLSPSKLATLAHVHHGGPMTPTELAAREKVKLQSLTRLLAELEAQGLLAREPHASDARQSVLSLSREGLAQLKAVARSRENSLAAAMARHLSAEEIATLQAACALMDRVAAELGEDATGADAQARNRRP